MHHLFLFLAMLTAVVMVISVSQSVCWSVWNKLKYRGNSWPPEDEYYFLLWQSFHISCKISNHLQEVLAQHSQSIKCNFLERVSWSLSLVVKSSTADAVGWAPTWAANPKASVFGNGLGMRLNNHLIFCMKKKTFCCFRSFLDFFSEWPG